MATGNQPKVARLQGQQVLNDWVISPASLTLRDIPYHLDVIKNIDIQNISGFQHWSSIMPNIICLVLGWNFSTRWGGSFKWNVCWRLVTNSGFHSRKHQKPVLRKSSWNGLKWGLNYGSQITSWNRQINKISVTELHNNGFIGRVSQGIMPPPKINLPFRKES